MPSISSTLRRQVAILRSILDELERWLAHGMREDSVRLRLLDELSRLERAVRDGSVPVRTPNLPHTDGMPPK
jgi:hypothetical protein